MTTAISPRALSTELWTGLAFLTRLPVARGAPDAGADVAFARQVPIGRITVPFSGNLNANLDAKANLGFAIPKYVFATPFLGGQGPAPVLAPGVAEHGGKHRCAYPTG